MTENMKFILSRGKGGGGVLSYITNIKCFVHEIVMLKSYFGLIVTNFVLCLISANLSENLSGRKTIKSSQNSWFFVIKIVQILS